MVETTERPITISVSKETISDFTHIHEIITAKIGIEIQEISIEMVETIRDIDTITGDSTRVETTEITTKRYNKIQGLTITL